MCCGPGTGLWVLLGMVRNSEGHSCELSSSENTDLILLALVLATIESGYLIESICSFCWFNNEFCLSLWLPGVGCSVSSLEKLSSGVES